MFWPLLNHPNFITSNRIRVGVIFQVSCLYGHRREKTRLRGLANNKGADQPAHPRSLISAFVICLLESIILKLATHEISFFYLVSVAEETGLSLAFSESPKTGFVTSRPIWVSA